MRVSGLRGGGGKSAPELVEKARRVSLGVNILNLLVGFVLVSVAAIGNIVPCPLCIGYWASHLALFVLFVKDRSEPRLVGIGQLSFLVAMICMSMVLFTHARSLLMPMVYRIPLDRGLGIGQEIPLSLKGFSSGYVVIVTNCSMCNKGVSAEISKKLSEAKSPFYVLAHEDAEKPHIEAEKVSYISNADFRKLRLNPTGAPHVFEIKSGRIVSSRTGRDFLRSLKRAGVKDEE